MWWCLNLMMNDNWWLLLKNDDDDDFLVIFGNYCNKEIDVCYSSLCKNGGVCKWKEGGFICFCVFNFVGKMKIFLIVMV